MPARAFPWLAWFSTLLFFGYQFILRLFPGLVMPQIMQKFSIDATAFGFLSAMYYFGYAGMQIPVAILLDRFGPKRVVSICALICALVTLVFAYSTHWSLALASRFLIGVTSAAGFLGTSKVVSLWFPKNMYARMIGYSFTLGLLGALYGGKPTSYLIDHFGFEKSLLLIAAIGLIIAAFVLFFVGKSNEKHEKKSASILLQEILSLLKNRNLLWLALANLLMVGALEGFADVWGVTYLTKAYLLSKSEAAGIISFVFVGMLFGGPVLAWFSERIKAHYVISFCGMGMAVLFLWMLLFNMPLNYLALCSIFFAIGILCCYQVIVFSVGSQLVVTSLIGIAVAFLNSINMLGGSFFHTIIGIMLDYFWEGLSQNSCKVYGLASYSSSLLVIPIASIIGSVIVLMMVKNKQHT